MAATNLSQMAWRNIWRNKRRTAITLSGIGFGVLFAVFFTSIQDANFTEMINLAARLGGGHVALQHPNFVMLPSLKHSTGAVAKKKKLALSAPYVDRVVARVTGPAMLATAAGNVGTSFIAVDPADEDVETLSLLEAISEGKFFEAADDKGIIIGAKLAENLETRMGRKVVYTLTDRNGEIVSGLARVSGIIKTGSPTVDAGLCLLPIDAVREVLGYSDDEAVQISVFLSDQRKSEEVAAWLDERLEDETVAVVWSENQPELSAFITMKVVGAVVFEIIILVLVTAGIFNTLFVSVMERMREFGILMAVGFSPRRLFGLVMWESAWLGVMGLITAALLTAWPYYYLATVGIDMSAMMAEAGSAEVAGIAMQTELRAGIYPENAALIAIVIFLSTVLSGLYPAWRAGRVQPVDTINLV